MSTLYVDNLQPNLGSGVHAAGHVVQLKVAKSTSLVTTSGSTNVSLGCPVAITPLSANSLLYIVFHGHHASAGDKSEFHLYKNGSQISMPSQSGIWIFDMVSGSETYNPETVSGVYSEIAGTTSTITFDVRGKEHGGASVTFNGRNYSDGHFGSTLTVMEIAQ
jgi:hypothetical protein